MFTATLNRHAYRLGGAAAALAAAAALTTAWRLWPQSGSVSASSPAAATPAWFRPISNYYGNDPRITPRFDFASLYSGFPAWFAPIRGYYHNNPRITPQFDFASLYAPPRSNPHR